MKKGLSVFLAIAAAAVCVIAVVLPQKQKPDYTIGICQFTQHDPLDSATLGFKTALTDKLGDKVRFIEQNANGDLTLCTSIVNDLVAQDVDLILANATNALLTAANATEDIPILGTSITDYSQIIGDNVSGTSDLIPADIQAAMISELFPDAKTIGIIYCSAESNSQYQADALKTALASVGYPCQTYLFAEAGDLSSVTMTAAAECDVLYIPTDNTVASNAQQVANICLPEKVPVITGEESTCLTCGVATISVDYQALGYATGEMAAKILTEGTAVSALPVQYAPSFTKRYNETICEQLGIDVPEGYTPLGGE